MHGMRLSKDCQIPVEIHALISSKEFENARSPFASELADPRIQLRSLALIPQGINNSTQPRRKLFLNASFDPDIRSDEKKEAQKTRLYAFTLNTDFKVQALSQRHLLPQNGGFLSIEQGKLAELDQSVRQLFRAELLERRAAGRQKNVAISYEFTPDITIWCSKSYPKKDGYPRLEAYICEPPPREKYREVTWNGELRFRKRSSEQHLSLAEIFANGWKKHIRFRTDMSEITTGMSGLSLRMKEILQKDFWRNRQSLV